MRKERIYIAITIVIYCLLVSGCGKTDSNQVSSIEKLQDSTTEQQIGKMNKEERNETLDKFALKEKERTSAVHIECGGHSGSGVIWKIEEDKIVLIANRHLLERSDKAEVSFATGIYYEAKVNYLSDEYDFGMAVIDRAVMDEEDVEALSEVSYSIVSKEDLVVGEPLFILTSKEYPADDILEGALVETSSMVELEQLHASQEMILGRLPDTEEKNVQAGMSGSGVYDEDGMLLGILSGGNGEKEYMVVPLWNILTVLGN